MSHPPHIFRVFVSSTFSDMKEERNALQTYVFPRLQDLCMRYQARFQAIDLRWGVSSWASLDQRTMQICLDEIARCQRVTPEGPNFITLLGDRYGYRPLPARIEKTEFEAILAKVSDIGGLESDLAQLLWIDQQSTDQHGWYRLDENAIPAEYVLLPREVVVSDGATDDEWKAAQDAEETRWNAIEKRLHTILLKAIDEMGWEEEDSKRFKYVASATEQEIWRGVLEFPDAAKHVFGFYRKILTQDGEPLTNTVPDDSNMASFIDVIDVDGQHIIPDTLANDRLIALKEKKLRPLLGRNIYDYEATWTGSSITLGHIGKLPHPPGPGGSVDPFDSDNPLNDCLKLLEKTDLPHTLCNDVWRSLASMIYEQLKQLKSVDALDIEIDAHERFGMERRKNFIGRTDILKSIIVYINSNDPHPLAVWGVSGSGKSALMAKAVEQAQKDDQNVLYRFIGSTPESSNGRALLESLCRQISRRYGANESTIPAKYKDLVQEFPKCLALATAKEPLVIFLDALDQLSDTDNARSLTWLPTKLPKNVRLVISTLPGECLQALEDNLPAKNHLEIKSLSVKNGKSILDKWFEHINRRLQDKQEQYLLDKFKKCRLPLYLNLAFEEARLWKSYDALPELSEDIPGILLDLFKRLSQESNHGDMLVSRSLGYLASGKNGLSEDELLDVLSLDQEVLADFQERSPKSPKSDRLPVVVWLRLYFDLEPYLTEYAADSTTLLTFYHPTTFGEAVRAKYADGTMAQKRHASLVVYFIGQVNFTRDDGKLINNVRKLSELPYQQTQAGLLADVKTTLTDLSFIAAKTDALKTWEVDEDFERVLAIKDDNVLHLLQRQFANMTHILNICETPNDIAGTLHCRLQHLPELAEACRIAERYLPKPFIGGWITSPDLPHPALIRTLIGHESYVYGCAISPDGRWIVSASHDNTLQVWDTVTGQVCHTLCGHTDAVLCCAFSPDGRWIVSASGDKMVKVWDTATGMEDFTLEGHTDGVFGCAVSPDGRWIVSASSDKTLEVWDIDTGHGLTLAGHTKWVNSCAISPDGRWIVSASADKSLKVWDSATGQERLTLAGHTDSVVGCAFSPDGSRIVSASADKTLKVWDATTGQERFTLEGHTDRVSGCAVSPDGCWIVSASQDTTLKVWNIFTGQENITLPGGMRGVNGCAYSPDGRWIVSASVGFMGGMLKVWDAAICQASGNNSSPKGAGHTDLVSGCTFSPDGHWIVSASYDTTLKVWDAVTGQERFTLEGHMGRVSDCAVSPDGRWIVSASSRDGTLKVWNAATGQARAYLQGHSCCAVSPDGRWIVSASHDGTLKVWAATAGQEPFTLDRHTGWVDWLDAFKAWYENRYTLKGHTGNVNSCAFSPDGCWIVSASEDKTLKVWDAATGQERITLIGHDRGVNSCAYSPDGRLIVSASMDDTVLKVWDAGTGQEHLTLKGHTYRLMSCAFSPDGRWIASVAEDAMLKIWDAATGDCLATFHADWSLHCCTWSPSGEHIVVGGKNGIYWLRLVGADPKNQIRNAGIEYIAGNKKESDHSLINVRTVINSLGVAIGDGATSNITINKFDEPPSLSPEETARLLTGYCARVLEDNRFVDLQGIPPSYSSDGHPVPLEVPLDKVFIRIQAITEKQRRAYEKHPSVIRVQGDRRSRSASIDVLPAFPTLGEYFYRRGEVSKAGEIPESIDPEEALKKHRRLVVLGAPGAGKSTLLRYLTRRAAEDLHNFVPILVSLRDYATALAGDSTLALSEFALHTASAGNVKLRQTLEDEIKNSHVLWLIDDLDETRDWAINAARQSAKLPGRLILTSRSIEYIGTGLEVLPHFEISPLLPENVDEFLHSWLGLLAPHRMADEEWIAARLIWLKEQLEARPSIQSLTRNLVLLAFLATLASEYLPLDIPEQRSELYRRYIEQLLDSLESERRSRGGSEGQSIFTLGSLRGEQARQVAIHGFYYLGWALHLAYYGGKPQEPPTRDTLIKTLAGYLQADGEKEARYLALAILEFWQEAGLLEVWHLDGSDYLAFRNLAIQEYAAAWVIADIWRRDTKRAWRFLSPRLYHYAWREPILLLADILLDTNVLIQHILAANLPFERQLYRNLRLAATIAVEWPDKANKQVQQVVQRMEKAGQIKLSTRLATREMYSSLAKIHALPTFPILLSALRDKDQNVRQDVMLALKEIGVQAIPTLLEALKDNEQEVRESAIEALGNIGDAQVIPIRIEHVNDGEWNMRHKAEHALVNLIDAQFIPTLLNLLQHDVSFKRALPGWQQALGELAYEIAPNLALKRISRDSQHHTEEYLRVMAPSAYLLWVAVKALGEIGQPAIPILLDALNCDDRIIRLAAVNALGKITDAQSISVLMQAALGDNDDWEFHANALRALEKIGPQAIPAFIDLLKSSKSNIRKDAAKAIGNIGKPQDIPVLLEALKDNDSDVRNEVAKALSEISDSGTVSVLQEMLKNKDNYIRIGAVLSLGEIGGTCVVPVLQIIPLLLEMLKDNDSGVRQAAVSALEKLGNTQIIPFIMEMLKDNDSKVREAAVNALGKIGDSQIVPSVLGMLKDNDSKVREATVNALGKIGCSQIVPSVLEMLKDNDSKVREATVNALGKIGDSQIIPFLRDIASDRAVSIAVAQTLGKIGGPQSTLALKDMITNGYPIYTYRKGIIPALGEIGDTKSIRLLRFLLKQDERDFSSSVIEALGQLRGSQSVLGLIEALGDENNDVRIAAAEALGNFSDPQVVSALQDALKDKDRDVRQKAAEALGNIGNPQAISALQDALKTEEEGDVREKAAEALGKIGGRVDSASLAIQIANLLHQYKSEHLEAVANRLSILKVETMPVLDPLLPVSPFSTLTRYWSNHL